MSKKTTAGFTFIELLVAIAVIGIIATLSGLVFESMREASALRVARQEVHTALLGARSLTLASDGDTVYGVRVAETSVTHFEGSAYVSTNPTNKVFVFENGVTATSSLLNTDIVYSRLVGEPSMSGAIFLQNSEGTATRTITVHASGLVE